MTLNYQKFKLTTAIVMIGIVLFLFFSFNSYWVHGNIDQSEIFQNSITQSNTQNILGFTGAKISYFFISSLGISAYLIISLILLFSIKALFKTRKINIINTLIQHLFLIIWISLFCAQLKNIALGGKIGLFMTNALLPLVGHFGIILTLTTSILIFVTIFLNIKLELIIKFIHLIREKLKLFQKTTQISEKEEEKEEGEEEGEEILQSNSNQYVNTDKSENEELHTIVELAQNENIVTENKILEKDSKNIQVEYKFPDLDLLKEYPENKISINEKEVESNKKLIEETLRDFKIDVKIKRATIGPTITLYEIVPDEGVRISKIKNLENDIALRIKAIGVRIIAPLPGKGTVGIEVPNQNPTIVSMKNVMESERFQNAKLELPIAIGKTISNETFVMDLTKMPHLLIAGATGQGKSVGLNTILCSILYKKHPSEVKFILVDPKKVELTLYNKIEKHFLAKIPGDNEAIITDTKQVINTLKSLCLEMDRRYELLKKAEVRNIQEYNQKNKNNQELGENKFLPYLILVIDEFADLIMTAGKEIEIPIARLAQLSRAIGIHLIIATQRPTTNIITGTIKANFPTRIAFRVIQGIDSKTILDTVGANQLIGRGDMLISDGSNLSRIQCAFIDTPEVEKLTNFIGQQEGFQTSFELPTTNSEQDNIKIENKDDRDPLFKDAALLIIMHQQGSTSMIQRKLKLGYNRAGRIIDQLEAAGIIGPLEGSKGRKVLIETEEELNQII